MLALLHEQRVADLAGGAGVEFVFERLAEQLRPGAVEGARQRSAPPPWPVGIITRNAARRIGCLRAGAARRDERQAGRGGEAAAERPARQNGQLGHHRFSP